MTLEKNQTAPEGVIVPDRLYSFKAFERTTGWGRAAMREARKNGLEVRYIGRTGYILGQTFIDYVLQHGSTSR